MGGAKPRGPGNLGQSRSRGKARAGRERPLSAPSRRSTASACLPCAAGRRAVVLKRARVPSSNPSSRAAGLPAAPAAPVGLGPLTPAPPASRLRYGSFGEEDISVDLPGGETGVRFSRRTTCSDVVREVLEDGCRRRRRQRRSRRRGLATRQARESCRNP